MDLTISRPVKIFALLAVVAAAAGGSMLMMKPRTTAAPVVVNSAAPSTVATTTAASTTAATTTAATTQKQPAAAPTAAASTGDAPAAAAKAIAGPTISTTTTPVTPVTPVTRAAEAQAPPVGANGLPTTIDAALAKHPIVVVSVFDPQSATDAIAYAEAKAGASDAGVGFVGVSLLDNPLAAALTSALPGGGLLPAPGVLIYRKPGTLVQLIDGFADRDAVAQAAVASVTATPITGSGS